MIATTMPYVPEPLAERTQVVHAPGGAITLHVRQWDPVQGRLCHRCTTCNRIDGPAGHTTCVVPWAGRLTLPEIRRREQDRGLKIAGEGRS